MKKWLIPLIIILVVGIGLYRWAVGFNNTAVEYEANAKTAWSNVESAYQRRNDLIGNLVKTVQGAADFERSTLGANWQPYDIEPGKYKVAVLLGEETVAESPFEIVEVR